MDATHEAKSGAAGGFGILQLCKHKDLFLNEAAYDRFILVIQSLAETGTVSLLLDDENPICGVVSTQDAQIALRNRIVSRLMQEPDAIDGIRQKLGDDRSIEYGSFEE